MALSFDEWVDKCKLIGFLGDTEESYQNYYYSLLYESPITFKNFLSKELISKPDVFNILLTNLNYDRLLEYSRYTQIPAEKLANVEFKDFRCELKKYYGVDTQDFFLDQFIDKKEDTENKFFTDITQHLLLLQPGYVRSQEILKFADITITMVSDQLPKLLQQYFMLRFLNFIDISVLDKYPEVQLKVQICKQLLVIYEGALNHLVSMFDEVRSLKLLTYGNLVFIVNNLEEFYEAPTQFKMFLSKLLEDNKLYNLKQVLLPI